MMRSVFVDAQLSFADPAAAAMSEEILLRMVGVVARLNLFERRRNPELPKLYDSGVKWCPPDQMEGSWVPRDKIPAIAAFLRKQGMAGDKVDILVRLIRGAEIFQDVKNLYDRKKGDCDRLVAARLAELWDACILASPYLIPYPNESGGTTYHAVVLHADGSAECPSTILGMKGDGPAYIAEAMKNIERRNGLLAVATDFMMLDGYSPEMLGSFVDAAGYVPRGGFRGLPTMPQLRGAA